MNGVPQLNSNPTAPTGWRQVAKAQFYALTGAACFGVATAVLGLIMLFIFPSSAELADGFRTPIIAFEFASTEADLAFLSGSSEIARTNRQNMDAGHRWDMVFPFAYAGFIALMLLQLALRGRYWLWIPIAIALAIIPLDIRENIILTAITRALENAEPTALLLQSLHNATWLKWGALGASIAALALGLAVERAYFSAILSAIAAVSIAACWLSGSEPHLAELMSAVITVFFFYFAVKMVMQAWKVTGPVK